MKIELVASNGNKVLIESESKEVKITAPKENIGTVDLSEIFTIGKIDA